jgi:large subunit ribosomal protein L3
MKTLIGQKIEMSQVFEDGGRVAPVTLIKLGPCVVTQVKTVETDGYQALQIGFGEAKKYTRPLGGHLKKSRQAPRFLREVRLSEPTKFQVGDVIRVSDLLTVGDKVAVTGISKGKGFAGVVKRWGFHGGPKTHGQSDRHRAPGSIGSQKLGRVLKGKKMAGRMGSRKVTVKGLKVIGIDENAHFVRVKGAVPGSRGSLLMVRKQ